MKSGFLKKSPENTEKSPIGSNQRFSAFGKNCGKNGKNKNQKAIHGQFECRQSLPRYEVYCHERKRNQLGRRSRYNHEGSAVSNLPHQQIHRPVSAPKRENPLRVHGQENSLLQNQERGCDCLSGNRKVFPESYSAPAGWYKGDYTVQMEKQVPPIVQEHLRLYYTELLSGYPDVLTTQMVSKITGYGKTAINNWCNQGHIKSFRKTMSTIFRRSIWWSSSALPTSAPSPANRRGTSVPCKAFPAGGKSVTCTQQTAKEVRRKILKYQPSLSRRLIL